MVSTRWGSDREDLSRRALFCFVLISLFQSDFYKEMAQPLENLGWKMYSINPEAPSAGPGPLITYTSKPVLVSKQVYTCTFTLRPHTSLSGPHTCKYGHHGHHPRWGEIFFFLLPPTNNIMLFRLHFLYEQVFFEHLPSGNELDRKHTSVKNKVSFFKN